MQNSKKFENYEYIHMHIEPIILAQTSQWLVVSKPAGWLTIAGRAGNPVLIHWARERYAPLWVVHRLDLETSGVVLFARSAEAHRQASLWFQKHEVKKFYDLLASGNPEMPVLRIAIPISGQPSVTQVEVKERFTAVFLAQARPLTGRRHQIRIHLAARGLPILGDTKYGGSASVPRVALHARLLELPTGECFEAPWPEDFQSWVRTLREKGRCT